MIVVADSGPRASLRDEAPAGEVAILMLAVQEELHGTVEQRECFGKTSLCGAERRLQVQEDSS